MALAAAPVAVGAPRQVWNLDLPEAVQGDLVAGGGRLFFALADGTLRALNLEDGTEKWRRSFGGDLEAGLVLAKGTLVLAEAGGKLRAFSSSSGEPVWDAPLQSRAVSLGAGETMVCVGEAGACSAYSIEKGASRWRNTARGEIQTPPWIGDTAAIYGSADHRLHIVNRETGAAVKSVVLTGEILGGPAGEPSAARRPAVAVGTHDGRLQLVLRSGVLVWSVPVRGVVRATPLLLPGVVIAGTDEGMLYSVDRDSGRFNWALAIGGAVVDRIVRLGDAVAVGAGGALVFVNSATGEMVGNIPVGGVIMSVAADSGRVVAATTTRRLVAAGLRADEEAAGMKQKASVASLVVEPRRLNLRKKGSVTVSFSLLAARSLTVDIADFGGKRVRLLDHREKAWPGDFLYEWDGKDGKGKKVSPGIYRVRLVAGTEEYGVGIEIAGRR